MFRKNRNQFVLNVALILALLGGMFGVKPARAATLTVINTNDSGIGSLRQAITDAVAGDTITFDPSLSGQTITLVSNLIINKDLTIDGSGLSHQITISGGNVAHLEVTGTIPPMVTISDLTISNGYNGGNGGAIYAAGNLTVLNSTLRNNVAVGAGGAIFGFQFTIKNTTIYQNQAGAGGAISILGNGTSTIINSTISQNQASDSGGAIFMMGNASIVIFNSTFAGNQAVEGKEVVLSGNTMLDLYNTIFACTPPENNNCYVLISNAAILDNNSIVGVGTLTDFGLAELDDNGGPTKTLALLPGSPLIDAGSDAVCADTHVNNLDQRGIVRPQGDHCDIGAYEIDELVVTKTVDTDDGICDSDCSLREAIADAASGAIITFDSSLAGGGLFLSSQLTINKNLTINGSMLNPPLTLSGGPITRIIYVDWPAHVTISGLILTNGNATSGNGGAVYAAGSFTAINSTFVNNSAGGSGGAIAGGTIKVINSTFSRNLAGGNGGAIIGVNLDISNTTIHQNQANQEGGAIAIYGDGTTTITNSTIFQNQAGNSGGGMFITGYPIVDIFNSTFAENTAVNGHEFILGTIYHIAFANTIFVCNATSDDCYVPAGNTILNTNSILGVGSLSDYGLSEPADHGGPTETMALLPDSPLIDFGDDSICANTPVNSLDQRGISRLQGSHCDIGAYEDQFIVRYVKQDAIGTGDGSSWTNAHTDLQSALAASSPDEEIWVAAGIYKPTSTTDRTISFNLKNGVAVYGGFAGGETSRDQRDSEANPTILSGDISVVDNNSDNSYHVVISSNTNNSALLDGFTLTAGNADGSFATSKGGGIYNTFGSPVVTNVIFSDNYATFGGGMYNIGHFGLQIGSNPILTNVSFMNNNAVEGGGMRNEDYSSPILTNVTFSDNSVVRSGGGMENFFHSDPILMNVTFDGNTSGGGGGGILNWSSSSPTLTNITFSGNSATDWGGGLYNDTGSNPILTNITMNGNEANEGGGIYNAYGSEPTITNSIVYGNPGGEIFDVSGTRVVNYSIVQGGYSGTGNLDVDPLLGPLQDNGGFTETMALQSDSPAIDSGNDATCAATDQRKIARPQGNHCDIGAFEYEPTFADVQVNISGSNVGSYNVPFGETVSDDFNVNGGPMQVTSTNGLPIFTSQRAIFKSSFNSIVGYPADQLTTEYWFTSYDDMGMITFLVIGNPDPALTAEVDVYISGNLMGHYSISPGQRVFPRYGINGGPVHVISTNGVNIFTSERTKFKDSFNEVMGNPADQLTTEYWFTSYDDAGMITYLVIGNPHTSNTAEVDVYIAGTLKGHYSIAPGQRVFPRYGINGGPVRVVSTNSVDIFTSERTKFKDSFNEVTGYPADQVYTEFWFTSYDDTSMLTYLIIGNPSSSQTAELDIYIAGVKQNTNPIQIAPGGRFFQRYGLNSEPVRVVSTNGVNVFASERSKYLQSFNEILGLADTQLTTDYWFTSYDDAGMTTFLVIGTP